MRAFRLRAAFLKGIFLRFTCYKLFSTPDQPLGGLWTPRGLLVQGNGSYVCDPFARKIFVYSL